MKKQKLSPLAEASTKFNFNPVNFQFDLPVLEMILETKAEIEALSAQAELCWDWFGIRPLGSVRFRRAEAGIPKWSSQTRS